MCRGDSNQWVQVLLGSVRGKMNIILREPSNDVSGRINGGDYIEP